MTDNASATPPAAPATPSAASALFAAPGPTGPAAPAAPAAPGATVQPASSSWLDGLDPEHRTFVEGKGWKSPAELASSYRNLEKLLGGEKIAKPKSDDDVQGWDAVHKALGRPDKPEEYKLPVPDGADPALSKQFSEVFHKAGLNLKQAGAVAEAWNAHVAKVAADEAAAHEAKFKQESEGLKREWGGQYDANIEAGKRAARQFGVTDEAIDALGEKIGVGATMRLLTKIGVSLGEDAGPPAGAGGRTTFATTKEAAQAQIKALQADPVFLKQYTTKSDPGHAAALEKMTRLQQVIAS